MISFVLLLFFFFFTDVFIEREINEIKIKSFWMNFSHRNKERNGVSPKSLYKDERRTRDRM